MAERIRRHNKQELVPIKQKKTNKGWFKNGHEFSVGNRGPQIRELRRRLPALLEMMLEERDPKSGLTKDRAILLKLINMALNGNLMAINMVLDRGIGKPTQAVEVSGNIKQTTQNLNIDLSVDELAQMYADRLKRIK